MRRKKKSNQERESYSRYTHAERMKHMQWCLHNDIKIYAQPIDYYWCRIVLEEKDREPIVGEKKYKSRKKDAKVKDEKWWERIYELYTEKYLKYNEKGQKDFKKL